MNTGLRVAIGMVVLAILGGLGSLIGYRLGCDPVLHEAACQGDAMAWIKHEYHLSASQEAAINKLQENYTDTCDEHCRKIRLAVRTRDALRKNSPENTQSIRAAEQELGVLSAKCEASLKEHLRLVAAQMNPQDGQCYLETMLPLLERFDHSGAPDLRLSAPTHEHEHRN